MMLFWILAPHASATVGGPTTIGSFSYNPADESVYFMQFDFGGRGCPPILNKISLNTGKVETVYSCEQGSEFLSTQGTYGDHLIYGEISKITEGFKPLQPISLKRNKIEIDVSFGSEQFIDDTDYVIGTTFDATLTQDGAKLSEFAINGCNLDQPFVFQGYDLPGFEKKIVLLISTKEDCFEGGYTRETLQIIPGISNIDRTRLSNSYKYSDSLAPNESTLIVYEEDSIPIIDSDDDQVVDDSGDKKRTLVGIFIIVLTFLIGIVLGRLTNKPRVEREL